jgi:hypothetical protein
MGEEKGGQTTIANATTTAITTFSLRSKKQ